MRDFINNQPFVDRTFVEQTIQHIQHELRTPLVAIHAGASALQTLLPILIETYERARAAGLQTAGIQPRHLPILQVTLEHIENEAKRAMLFLDQLTISSLMRDI